MDICARIKAYDLETLLCTKNIETSYLENYRVSKVYPTLKSFIVGDGKTLDGEALKQEIFPTNKFDYDVFISHSHNDIELVTKFAAYLEKQCGLSVFLDSYVWKSADGLLRRIDDMYCRQKDGRYNYKRRNFSTSHVHAMLSMAILEIIDKAFCSIFIESERSIKLSNLKKTTTAVTLSPWVFEELCMIKYIRRRSRIQNYNEKSFSYKINEGLRIAHMVDINTLFPLSISQLESLDRHRFKWLKELSEIISYNYSHNVQP